MSDWIEWNGGDCPVSEDTIVEVKFQPAFKGEESGDRRPAGEMFWDQKTGYDGTPSWGNIIAYRVVSP